MATESSEITQDIYQLKVTLLGTNPPIWRRILVPADLSLAKLHKVLQIAMGWHDEHMHEFRAGRRRFGRPEPPDPFMRMPHVESERTVLLSAVLGRAGAKMTYSYYTGMCGQCGKNSHLVIFRVSPFRRDGSSLPSRASVSPSQHLGVEAEASSSKPVVTTASSQKMRSSSASCLATTPHPSR